MNEPVTGERGKAPVPDGGPVPPAPVGEEAPEPAAGPAPPWFRAVVSDSLLGALCPLLPVPIVDDIALARMRRRMVERLASRWGVTLTPGQLAWLAGGGRPFSVPRFLGKALIYPFKELLRKILYFLAIKDAVDTFSLLFHQGYLLHAALAKGFLRGPSPDDAHVWAVTTAVHGTLTATDTRPLRQLLLGVLRNSRRLVRAAVRWLGARLRRSAGGPPIADVVAIADEAAAPPVPGSPEVEQLLDRLLLVLWGQRGYLGRLESELDRRLGTAGQPAAG